MKWLPYHRFEFDTALSHQAAMETIRAHVEPVKWLRWRWPSSANDDRFEGDVIGDRFDVRRIIGYRNSFLPEIEGEVLAADRRARVKITMRLSYLVIGFVALWVVFALGAFLSALSAQSELSWFALLMIGFIYAMTMGAFWFEASKQERVLRRIFQAS